LSARETTVPNGQVPRLVFVRTRRPELVGTYHPLTVARCSIGRELHCTLVVDEDDVSREHAVLELTASGEWRVTDNRSTNGTFVNGGRVRVARLADGDYLSLGGGTLLRFFAGTSVAAARPSVAPAQPGAAEWSYDRTSGELSVSPDLEALLWAPLKAPPHGPLKLSEFVVADDMLPLLSALEAGFSEKSVVISVRTRVGDKHLELRGQAPTDGGDQSVLSGTARDVSARAVTGQRLRAHAMLLDCLADAVALLDVEGRVIDCNQGAARLFGRRKDELIGSVLDAEDAPSWAARAIEATRQGERFEGTRDLRLKDGRALQCEVTVIPLLDVDRRALGYVAAYRDVTDSRVLQQQLLQRDRLAALGTLSAGIAHEVNNPLAFLQGNIEYCAEVIDREEPDRTAGLPDAREALADCLLGIKRLATIARDLKYFSRGSARPASACTAEDAVQLAVKMAGAVIRHTVSVTVELSPAPPVQADESMLTQVLLNLLINAAQAMPPRDTNLNRIVVRVREDGGGTAIEVVDNGKGMTPEELRRAFDPFFTTKAVGAGTGLGLAVCHGIIDEFCGTITARLNPDQGATFRIWLPSGKPIAEREPVLAPAQQQRRKILVVDDEVQVAKSLRRTLSADHDVILTLDGTEALRHVRARTDFDCVLCDVAMPIMSGVDLHDVVTNEAPELAERFVFLTGGVAIPELRERLEASGRPVIDKPVDRTTLLTALENVFRRRAPPRRPDDSTIDFRRR
jgi:PAS domain S-box-containing protein